MVQHAHDDDGGVAALSSTAINATLDALLSPSHIDTVSESFFSQSCTPSRFNVALFDNAGPDYFGSKNEQAHVFLGMCLAGIVGVWSAFAMDYTAVRLSLRLSSFIQMAMGGYLLLWLFVLLYPTDMLSLASYSLSDLLQLQHFAIALLLLCSGAIEYGQCISFLTSHYWCLMWTLCMVYVGLIFFAHPQHGYWATVQHMTLGFAMIIGSILFGRVKEELVNELVRLSRGNPVTAGRTRRNQYARISNTDADTQANDDSDSRPTLVDCTLILSGVWFSLSACVLILFKDHSHGEHTGTSVHCQPSWPLTFGGFLLALVAVGILSVTTCLYSPRCRPLANRCCPVNEEENVWCCLVNTCLCVKPIDDDSRSHRRVQQLYGDVDDELSSMANDTASSKFAVIVSAKEEEERRERARAIARLKQMEQILAANSRPIRAVPHVALTSTIHRIIEQHDRPHNGAEERKEIEGDDDSSAAVTVDDGDSDVAVPIAMQVAEMADLPSRVVPMTR